MVRRISMHLRWCSSNLAAWVLTAAAADSQGVLISNHRLAESITAERMLPLVDLAGPLNNLGGFLQEVSHRTKGVHQRL